VRLASGYTGHSGPGIAVFPLLSGVVSLSMGLLQGGLPAQGISDEHVHEIDHLLLPEASPGEANVLLYRGLNTLVGQLLGDERHFPNQIGVAGTDCGLVWTVVSECAILLVKSPDQARESCI
jgi:hypothetical protein